MKKSLGSTLEALYDKYHRTDFIADDPVSVPHRFKNAPDIEIAGFFAANLAWGQRKSIIKSLDRLLELMDLAPYEFITGYESSDLKRFRGFVHRTFNEDDLLFFLDFFQMYFRRERSLENLFLRGIHSSDNNLKNGLIHFYNEIFSHTHLQRTEKHIANPLKKSACKRMNLFLRWMVRNDDKGIDFGIWKSIGSNMLICPLDVHVHRSALYLGLTDRKQADWQTAEMLTRELRKLDAQDPVRFDFALFGLSIEKGW